MTPTITQTSKVKHIVKNGVAGQHWIAQRGVEKSPQAQRLMTHPGVGPLTALAFVLIIGKAERFQCGKQISAYLGLVPLEESSG